MSNLSLVIEKPEQINIIEKEIPTLNENEVLIEVKASGICGTDIHIFEGSYMGSYPVIPGHEFSGVVKAVGNNVKRIKVGDHVAVEPNIACDNCWYCLNNEQNFCENWQAVGVTLPGGMAQYVKAPEKATFNIGKLSFIEGAFVEPLSCILHGIEKLNLKISETVLIVGAGPIGLLLMQVLMAKGVSKISIVEVDKNRANSAEAMGANKIYLSFDECKKRDFDVVVDATGAPKVMEKSLDFSRMGGKVLLFGVPPMDSKVTFDAFQIFRKGLRIMSSFTSVRNSYQAISLLQSGLLNVKELVTHQLTLEEFEKGIKIIKNKTENSMKIMILPND